MEIGIQILGRKTHKSQRQQVVKNVVTKIVTGERTHLNEGLTRLN